jgi:hypothetical protein
MSSRFAPGEVVKLKSGGWRWTVEAVEEGEADDRVTVITITKDAFVRQHLPSSCLVLAEGF